MVDTKKKKVSLGLSNGSFPSKPESAFKPKNKSESKNTDTREEVDDYLTDVKNEQLVLGQALNNKICLNTFVSSLNYEDFIVENHKVIAFCIEKATHDGVQITDDVFDVYRYDYPSSEKATGGLSYISKLRKGYSEKLTSKSYLVFVNKLKSDAVKFKIQGNYIKRLMRLARDPSTSLEELNQVTTEIEGMIVGAGESDKTGFKTMKEVNKAHNDEIERRKNKDLKGSTGFSFLDEYLTNPFASGEVTIVAGRPGAGKSTFVVNSMMRLANKRAPIPSALFALEMDAVSTLDRLNAIETDIPLKTLIGEREKLTPEELKREDRAKDKRESKPIYICDDVRMSMSQLRRHIKRLVEDHGVRVVFIDLFMKLQKPKGMNNKSTTDQYTEMLNEIQRYARELGVHIVCVVQIGRKAEARNDKRPVMSDLKDSGAFEEIADLILLFYREAYYLTKDVADDFSTDIMEIIIAKQRQGATGTVKAVFKGETTKIKKANQEDLDDFDRMVAALKPKETKEKKKW